MAGLFRALEFSPDPLSLIRETCIPPPRAKLWPIVKFWLKALPDGLVRLYIWQKGPKFGRSAKSGGREAIGLKPLTLGHQPSTPLGLEAVIMGLIGHPSFFSCNFIPIKGRCSFAEWKSSSVIRSWSGAWPNQWPWSFRWETSAKVNLFLAAKISRRGYLKDKCHLCISSHRFRGQALRSS